MANLPVSPEWAPDVYQIETTDKVLGGPDGVVNLQAKQLADRTAFLKDAVESAADVAAGADAKAGSALAQIADVELAAGSAAESAASALQYKDDALAAKALAELAQRTAAEDAASAAAAATGAAANRVQAGQMAAEAGAAASAAVQAASQSVSERNQVVILGEQKKSEITALADASLVQMDAVRDDTVAAKDVAVEKAQEATMQAGTATDQASVASGQANIATTQAGLASAAKTAAESAAQVAQLASVYSTVALGLAGTTNGKYFGVKQTYGDAIDIYLNSSGTAVYQQTRPFGIGEQYEQVQLLQRVAANVPAYPVEPIFELRGIDQYDVNNRFYKNRKYTGAVSSNLMRNNSGNIQRVTTQYYATGPSGETTACRVTINNFYTSILGGTEISANCTARMKVKSNAGAGTLDFKIGQYTQTMVAVTTNESAWTEVTWPINSSFQSYSIFIDSRDGTTKNIDILIDEIQLYEGSSIPVAFSAEPKDFHARRMGEGLRTPNSSTRSGVSIDTTATHYGLIPMPTLPSAKTFTEGTIVLLFSTTDTGTIAAKAISAGNGEGIFDVGINNGNAYGIPGWGRGASGLFVANKGYQLAATRFKNGGERAFFLNGIKVGSGSSTSLSFTNRFFGLFGDTNAMFPFKGKVTAALLFDRWLDDSQIASVFSSVKAQHALSGEPSINRFNFYWAEGDSITAQAGAGGSPYPSQFYSANKASWFNMNLASSGSNHTSAVSRQARLVEMVQACVAGGNRAVVSYFMGANGIPTQQQILDYGTAIRNAGAKFIMCTILPKGSDSSWETQRLAYNTMLRNNPSLYDALADFGASPTIGAFGAPTARVYYYDDVHLNNAGETEAYNIINPLIQSFKAY